MTDELTSSLSPSEGTREDLDERVKAAVGELPGRPRCAVIGGGFAGLATAYHLAAYGSDVTVFDPNEVGSGGASSVAAGLLHPLTPRGKIIWKGAEGLAAAKELIEVGREPGVRFPTTAVVAKFTVCPHLRCLSGRVDRLWD